MGYGVHVVKTEYGLNHDNISPRLYKIIRLFFLSILQWQLKFL